MKNWKKKLGELSFTKGYYFKMGDNGLVEKKDDQLIFTRKELEHFIEQELDRVREEGRKEELESLDKWYYKRLEKEFNPFGYVLHEEIFNRLSKLN